MYLVNSISCPERFTDHKDTAVSRSRSALVNIRNNQFFVFDKPVHTLSNHTESFLDRSQRPSDSHYFTHQTFILEPNPPGLHRGIFPNPSEEFYKPHNPGRFKESRWFWLRSC